jgi:hypothetical protein
MKPRMGTLSIILSALFLLGCGAVGLVAPPTTAPSSPPVIVVITGTSAFTSTPAPAATITLTPAPTDTLTNTPSPTPSVPSFTLIKNAFCRKGPDVSWPDVTGIVLGETVTIQGVSEDGFWYFVYLPRYKVKCWVAAPTGLASGDLTGVPVMEGPPTPTPT